jgi:hypothetical protein
MKIEEHGLIGVQALGAGGIGDIVARHVAINVWVGIRGDVVFNGVGQVGVCIRGIIGTRIERVGAGDVCWDVP